LPCRIDKENLFIKELVISLVTDNLLALIIGGLLIAIGAESIEVLRFVKNGVPSILLVPEVGISCFRLFSDPILAGIGVCTPEIYMATEESVFMKLEPGEGIVTA
jgi:hypothetical protein